MRQYSASEKHYLSILQINSITCWEINENESTAVMGFRPIFQARAHFLLKVNMLPELLKSDIAYVYTCTEDEFASHSDL